MTTKNKLSILGLTGSSAFALILFFAFSAVARNIPLSESNNTLPFFSSKLIQLETQQKPVIKKKAKSTIKSISPVFKPDSVKQKKDTTSIPEFQSPEFPGGITELKKFICNNFTYPKEAIEHKVEGGMEITFSVSTKGIVTNFQIYKAIGLGCDEELIRIMKIAPLWKPRIKNYKAISSDYFIIRVNFTAQNTKLEEKDLDIEEEFPLVEGSEQNPEFQGGLDYLMNYLKSNTRYNIEAQKLGLHGTVFVQFVVSKTGKITKTRILRGIGNPCDNEALRVVSLMPDWIPGRVNGQPVDVMFQIPIKFEVPK